MESNVELLEKFEAGMVELNELLVRLSQTDVLVGREWLESEFPASFEPVALPIGLRG